MQHLHSTHSEKVIIHVIQPIIMEKAAISTHADLLSHIMEIRASKDAQEASLKVAFKELALSLSPVEVAKSSIHNLVNDKGVQFDLIKGGMNLGSNFLIDTIFKKQSGIKGFLSSIIMEKVSSSFIQANAANIIVGVTKLFSKKQPDSEQS